MRKISAVLEEAAKLFETSGIPEFRREAKSLLAAALARDQTFIIANPDYSLTDEEGEKFRGFVERRAAREPFQHIVGTQEFWGLDFIVTSDVLIPRPETEMIVQEAIGLFFGQKETEICEVGVGSGCISVSILHELKSATVSGFDVSEKALLIAAKNAAKHSVSERLNLEMSNVFDALSDESFDLIISNPPYIPAGEISKLEVEVKDFDPIVALTGGSDGLSIIEIIANESPKFLKPDGFLLMEIGIDQSGHVAEMFDLSFWKSCKFVNDLQGIPRLVKAQIRSI